MNRWIVRREWILGQLVISSKGAKAGELKVLNPQHQASRITSAGRMQPIVVVLQQSLRVAPTQIHDRVDGMLLLIGEWQLGLVGACASSPGFDHRPGAVDSFSA